jgi:outer membrane protein OmpA-like peptidoglycan-associated protein
MTRLAVPILILLLMLFAGAVWAVVNFVGLPHFAGGPPTVSEQQASPKPGEPRHGASATGDASFDVARIDPKGTSVFAGRAEPGSTVTITGDGQALGTAEADENGEWTFATEHAFASADPKLALSVKSAAQTKADAAANARVAGSLEAHEAAKEPPKSKTASSVSTQLLKEFEGVVAAARTEAKEKDAKATEPAASAEAKERVEVASAAPPAASETAAKSPPPEASPGTPPPTVALNEPRPGTAAPMRLAAAPPETPTARKTIPVPITFLYDEANFTDNGKKAAELLLEYLEIKHFPRVSLTGHADERGTPEFNMDLSKERLDTVAQFLKAGGYKGQLELIPKGESEPFMGIVRSQYSKEDLYQFDRRVELIIAP